MNNFYYAQKQNESRIEKQWSSEMNANTLVCLFVCRLNGSPHTVTVALIFLHGIGPTPPYVEFIRKKVLVKDQIFCTLRLVASEQLHMKVSWSRKLGVYIIIGGGRGLQLGGPKILGDLVIGACWGVGPGRGVPLPGWGVRGEAPEADAFSDHRTRDHRTQLSHHLQKIDHWVYCSRS